MYRFTRTDTKDPTIYSTAKQRLVIKEKGTMVIPSVYRYTRTQLFLQFFIYMDSRASEMASFIVQIDKFYHGKSRPLEVLENCLV